MLKVLLLPFALVYGAVSTIRNWLFDSGILKSKAYGVPVVVVGNITVGGTGKTPHIEYLAHLLADRCRLAVVSRGYGRATKGYLEVEAGSLASSVGDEPLQIKRKFPGMTVAVDEVRTHAIDKLLKDGVANTFLLDDAFQHRHVKAGVNVVLVDYNRPIFFDVMLPAGRLREPRHNIDRADMVIVSKCPCSLGESDKSSFVSRLNLKRNQPVFFTRIGYAKLQPINNAQPVEDLKGLQVLAVTGISQPERMYQYLRNSGADLHYVEFADHHAFTSIDIDNVKSTFEALNDEKAIVVFTEKDVARLSPELRLKLGNVPAYCLPIQVEFLSDADKFDALILDACKCK